MKKFLIIIFCLVFIQSVVFADEIFMKTDNVENCKIDYVTEGFVGYKKDGRIFNLRRYSEDPVFKDYVDVKVKWYKKNSEVVRYSGRVTFKDQYDLTLDQGHQTIVIPWWKVKTIGLYYGEEL